MPKILLVEDDEKNRDILARRLARRGYEVVSATDGQEGLDLAGSAFPDVILMDMSLPIIDGWEATRRIKAAKGTAGIPVIALTAHAMSGDREQALEAGCDDYDTKPIELDRLLGKIAGQLERTGKSAPSHLTVSSPKEKTLLAKLRHDLRTPINHILGYSELLQKDLADGGVSKLGDLENIQAAARQLLEIIGTRLSEENFAGPNPPESPTEETGDSTRYKKIKDALQFVPPKVAHDQSKMTGRILVVDDQPENREVLVKRLKIQGHQTAQAENGRLALELLSKSPFDLVLLDVMMPDMDGYTALGRMKADPALRHIPVIMISALDEIETVVRCIEAGAEDFLPKPFSPTLLRARIEASLEKKTFRDQEQAYLRQIEETQKRLEGELQEAARYVVSILPPPMEKPFAISWAYDPSTELGGDSFGYHWIDENHFAIYLLDVCGHGVGAALHSVAAINVIRSASLPHTDFLDPAQVLSSLNDAFQMERHNNMYFTIWYGVYDLAARAIRHASAGHPPALLLRPAQNGADAVELLRCPGMLVGAMPDISYQSETTSVPENARLFVFCDGAYEIKRPDHTMLDFDDEFVPYLVRNGRSSNISQEVLNWVRSIHGTKTLADDFSFLAIDFSE